MTEPAGPEELIDAVARVLHARDPHRMHSVFEDEGPSYTETARALAAAGFLADPAQTAELEEWRESSAAGGVGWSLHRVREALGTPDGRAASVHAAEVRKERDMWEAEYERVRDLKLTDLADALSERDLALWLHAEAKWWLSQYMHDVTQWRKQLLAAEGERDRLQARVDAAIVECNREYPIGRIPLDELPSPAQICDRIRAALQGDQPTEPEVRP